MGCAGACVCLCACVCVTTQLCGPTNNPPANERRHSDCHEAPGEMLPEKLQRIKWLSGLRVPCSNLSVIKGPMRASLFNLTCETSLIFFAVFPVKVKDSKETYVSKVLTCTEIPGEK